jgi:hypothetical protein
MNESDMRRLQEIADAKWRASIPGSPFSKRERTALMQMLEYGVGVLIDYGKIKGCGAETAERLDARGCIEIRRRSNNPNRTEGYVLTPSGLEAAQALARRESM